MVHGCFLNELLKELKSNICNSYEDNYDFEMCGFPETSIKGRIERRVKSFLRKNGVLPGSDIAGLFSALQPFAWFLHRFEALYGSLADAESRDLLVKIVAFRVLGHEKVKLPLSTEHFWKQRDELKSLMTGNQTMEAGPYSLKLFDLAPLHYHIRLFDALFGIHNTFVLKQYEYRSDAVHIKAEKGEVVLDAGGGWGDTALYFAHEVGEVGKVYSVEFMPSNLQVMEKNLQLNIELQERIEIVRSPIWGKPDVPLHFTNDGPSSRGSIGANGNEGEAAKYYTTTIDNLVDQNDLNKVDFIKMDIESSEVEALQGAERTIRKHRPKLAISVYHSVSDFVDVFEFVSSLNLGYKFYLGHYTIYWYETVLFAECETAR